MTLSNIAGSVSEGHFVVVFHFRPGTTRLQCGEAIHDLFLQVGALAEKHPHVTSADVAIPGDPLQFLFSKP